MKLTIVIFVLIELIMVSYLDFRDKKISNYWIILNLAITVLFYLFLSEIYIFDWNIFLYPVSFLILGFILFAINLMGAGDAKFLFSIYLMLPLEIHDEYFTSLLVTTIFVSIFNLLFRAYNRRVMIYHEYLMRNYKNIMRAILGKKMPFAPVMMIAWVLFILDYIYDVY
ncbi:MAG: hypothetical protein A2381_14255 [Bdellovibrionales bacterium RIFOXYB1_FULL_37_110]|nr:MAG: hypothetical protein A2181_05490 [Bdellovibrionales bacterium RIFOXYA1_FULL_38_20]OFZ47826.1 MAG: hypothetical protein A2417_15250 [Bdellovibrionales bacterium RIFOXYC1_FULL_37_79]OFZ54425.1 MAG: hypothetical protein A2328_00695 [Bdellovibrionales bacterium RIFOXYB2_FULL_36_6]OFZ57573.1 MAG: hypothetical protein A2381_14255 [Bdellovibrionales bacterium RIFOXYB1_FULL_37_110]OFZ61641.1 MAG: hypothetical protein A2577_10655 [Bdellovibrionales bacterium RIFOXYD1_FULL_36_51]